MKYNAILQRGYITVVMLIGTVTSGIIIHKGVEEVFGKETITFVKNVVTNTSEVGALLPCSKYVAIEITKHIRDYPGKKIRILEVGSGTGILTEQIVKDVQDKESYHIDLVELNTDFCKVLEERFGQDENVHIHPISILDWESEEPYDVIISTLPFNIFSQDFIQAVFDKYQNMLTLDGYMSYVELGLFPTIGKIFMTKDKRAAIQEKIDLVHSIKNQFLDETVLIKRNIPHIYVHHLKFTD